MEYNERLTFTRGVIEVEARSGSGQSGRFDLGGVVRAPARFPKNSGGGCCCSECAQLGCGRPGIGAQTKIVTALKGEFLGRDGVPCHFPHNIRTTGNSASSYARKGNWKRIRFYAEPCDQTDRFELYNLNDDIGEKSGLADRMPERAREMNTLIASFLQETNAISLMPDPNYKGSEPGG